MQRQNLYAFGVVSPNDGTMDSLVLPWVNARMMSLFLAEVGQRHADEFVLMVMDQSGWHIANALVVPENMRLLFLPLYSPELNPAEHLWERCAGTASPTTSSPTLMRSKPPWSMTLPRSKKTHDGPGP